MRKPIEHATRIVRDILHDHIVSQRKTNDMIQVFFNAQREAFLAGLLVGQTDTGDLTFNDLWREAVKFYDLNNNKRKSDEPSTGSEEA